MKKMIRMIRNQSIRTQLIIYFLAVAITIGGSILYIIHRNQSVMQQQEQYLEYIAKVSQISRIQDENEKLLGDLILQVSEEKKQELRTNIETTEVLLGEIKKQTNYVEVGLRVRVMEYLLKRFQNQTQEMIWLKEFEHENEETLDYESSYYQVYLKNRDIISRMNSYIHEILVTSIDENKESVAKSKKDTMRMRQVLVVTVVVILFLAMYFYYFIAAYITSLVKKILHMTKQVSHGKRVQTLETTEAPKEIHELIESFNILLTTMDTLSQEADQKAKLELQLAEDELEKTKMRELLKEAQLQGLQMQIQPHFLFNTLNVISMMAMLENSSRVYDLIVALSKFLRHSLKKESSIVPLLEEVDMVKQYLYIIKARMGEQLDYQIHMEVENEQIDLPLFTLQPLVENAFKHGLEDKMEKGLLRIDAKMRGEVLLLRVFDNGKGMTREVCSRLRELIQEKEIRLDQEAHIGVKNVVSRLNMIYGERVRYEIRSKEGQGTIFAIYINVKEG